MVSMVCIKDLFHSNTGVSQYRLDEDVTGEAKIYTLYGQNELYEDIYGVPGERQDRKQIKTTFTGDVLEEGDLLFSAISGEATIVGKDHVGYIFTQNYVRMVPTSNKIDLKYMMFLINEDPSIKRQFQQNLQGSQVIRYSLKLLKDIELPQLPPLEVQRIIGDVYYKELRVRSLQQRVADNMYTLRVAMLQGV